jgi:hypothetical protein
MTPSPLLRSYETQACPVSADSVAYAVDRLCLRATVAGILDRPLPAFLYFDKLAGWLKYPLSIRQQARQREYCPNLYCLNTIAKFDRRYGQYLQLPQLTEAALQILIDSTDDDMLLNYGEIALDLLPPDSRTCDGLLDIFRHSFLQLWHGGQDLQAFHAGFSTRRFQRGKPKRGHWFYPYADKRCRIDGHPFCFHMQSCVQGAQFMRRIGVHRPSDLLRFEFISYWRKWLRLYRPDFERLGRFDLNRRTGSSRRKARTGQWGDDMLGARLYHILSSDRSNEQRSLQYFVNSYGRGPYLTQMPIHILCV